MDCGYYATFVEIEIVDKMELQNLKQYFIDKVCVIEHQRFHKMDTLVILGSKMF